MKYVKGYIVFVFPSILPFVHPSMIPCICPSVHPSIQVLTFYIKVLHEVFALIFLKANPLGCLRMINITSL